MRRSIVIILGIVLSASCSKEKTTPASATAGTSTATTSTQAATPQPPMTPSPASTAKKVDATYAGGMQWFRGTKGFHFLLDENGRRAEGDLARANIGQERVRFTADGGEWLGISRKTGVHWYRRNGSGWTVDKAPPEIANSVWQRTTLAFDPMKKEGEAQADGSEPIDGVPHNRFRFTNANTGDVHQLSVSTTKGNIAKLKIESRFTPATLTITRPDEAVNIEDPGK
ncbi:MAG TPA: hypothetical protein VGF69_08745 [Thermoanaerobaculia bacterium]